MTHMTLYDLIGRHGEAIIWWQMSARAIVVFIIGLVFVRIAGKRVFGKWGALDILLAVIIGSNLGRAITGGAPFAPTLAATAVLVGLHTGLVYAAIAFPALGDWLKGSPTQLIADGQIDWRQMRREGLGPGDLDQALRCAGHLRPDEVEAAYLERNGDISIVTARPSGSASA